MKTIQISVEVPDGMEKALGFDTPAAMTDEFRLLLAVKLFEEARVSIGRAAEMCGMTKLDFMDELARRKIPVVNWDEEEIRRELQDA